MYFKVSSTATGTAYFMLPQLEQGTTATVWRNAPADDAPIVWDLFRTSNYGGADPTYAGAAAQELDPRDTAANFFLPWDAWVELMTDLTLTNTGVNPMRAYNTIDGATPGASVGHGTDPGLVTAPVAGAYTRGLFTQRVRLAAGKHRATLFFGSVSGTTTAQIANSGARLRITAYRGK